MDKFNNEKMIGEIRNLTSRLNNLSDSVREVNDEFEQRSSSEQKFYAFLETLVDKLIQYQHSRNVK